MLLEAVNSCLKQSLKNIEVIVYDDASTDGTDELMKTVTDERVHYFRGAKNAGVGPDKGRKFGLERARGKYITFLDHDDYYVNYDFFAKAVRILDEHEHDEVPIAFVGASAVVHDERIGKYLRTIDVKNSGRVNGFEFLMHPWKYPKPASVFPTVFNGDILRQIDFEKYSIGDAPIYMQSALHGDVWYLRNIVGVYRVHGGNETFGVKNPEYQKNLSASRIKGIRTWKHIRDNLAKHYGKMRTNLWYTEKMNVNVSYSLLAHRGFKDVLQLYYITFKETGFMPIFWIVFPIMRLRVNLRKITPLRKLYKFIKYRILRRPKKY